MEGTRIKIPEITQITDTTSLSSTYTVFMRFLFDPQFVAVTSLYAYVVLIRNVQLY